jgi:hypothetical protein
MRQHHLHDFLSVLVYQLTAQAGEGLADSGHAPLERPTVEEVGLNATGLGTEQLDTVVVELVPQKTGHQGLNHSYIVCR